MVELGVLDQLAVEFLLASSLVGIGNEVGNADQRQRDELCVRDRVEDGGQVAPEVFVVDFHCERGLSRDQEGPRCQSRV